MITDPKRRSLLALLLLLAGCGPPTLGPDRDAFKAVDALYTAVSLRELPRVEPIAARLKTLQAEGKLPDAAARSLAAIIAQARAGRWEPAQLALSRFMEGQRR